MAAVGKAARIDSHVIYNVKHINKHFSLAPKGGNFRGGNGRRL